MMFNTFRGVIGERERERENNSRLQSALIFNCLFRKLNQYHMLTVIYKKNYFIRTHIKFRR